MTDQRTGPGIGPDFVADKSRTAFLDIARALAAILVVYTHIYNVFILEHKGVQTPATDVVDNAFTIPLRLDDQGIGAISVPIFFLISGFVVTPIALRMGPGRFGINRVFRIYPLLLFVVALSAVLIALGQGLLSTRPQEVSVGSFLSNASLWNFIDRPFGAWVGVAWTLAVEILFYAMLVAVLPLLRTRAWLAIAVQLEIVLVLLITYRAFGDEYRALVINMVYTLIPIMGQAVWAAWSKRIPAWLAGLYVTAAWLMFVWAGHLGVDPNYIPRPFPIAFALLLFLLGLFAEPYLRQRRVWTGLSERTYSIYLLHGSVAFPLMHLLFEKLPLWLTVLIAAAATGVAAELAYRLVERPSHGLARRLSRRPARVPEPEPDEDPDEEPGDDQDDLGGDRHASADAPTEKTPPVAPPPRRLPPRPVHRPRQPPAPPPQQRPVPGPRPVPIPVELSTEKIQPVEPPRRPAVDPRPAPAIRPAPPGRRRAAEVLNGSLGAPPANGTPQNGNSGANGSANGGRMRAQDILNGFPEVANRNGGRRRLAEPAPAGNGGPVAWPAEQDDQDGVRPTGGRHRSD